MESKRLVAALLMAGMLSACGSGSDSDPDDKPTDPPPALSGDVPLPPGNGDLPDIAVAPPASDVRVNFELTEPYQVQVTDLAVNAEGLWCQVQRGTDVDNPLPMGRVWQPGWQQSMSCHSDGQQTFRYQPQDGAIVVDMAVQDGSRVLLLEAVPSAYDGPGPAEGWFELRFTQLDGAGNTLQQRWLEDQPDEQELYYYFYERNAETPSRRVEESLSHNNRPQIGVNTLARLQVHDGVPYLVAHTYGVKVYRFNSDLTVAWDQQIMPANRDLWFGDLTNVSRMAVRDDGAVVVAFELFQGTEPRDDNARLYQAHFGQPLADPNPGSDVGISVLSPDGVKLRTFIAGLKGHDEALTSVLWRGDELLLTGGTRYGKADAAGGSSEWDSYLARIDSTTGETLHSQLVHVHDEDMLLDTVLTDSGRLLMAGESGFSQADSNSQMTYGYGVIYEVNDAGDVLPLMRLDKPRNSRINGIQVVGDTLYYRYDFDGYITHTCDTDKTLCWSKAGVSNLRLP